MALGWIGATTAFGSSRPAPTSRRRRRWQSWQAGLDSQRLVFIDETWIKTSMAPLRGWGPKGERVRSFCTARPLADVEIGRLRLDNVLRELHHFARELHLWNFAEIIQLISDLVREPQAYAASSAARRLDQKRPLA